MAEPTRVVCPGSFDPVTHGHLDIIARASRLFDEVVVAVLVNESKKGLFSIPERLELIEQATSHLPNVSTDSFHGLLVDYCSDHDITGIVKGLRAASDFDYELPMAHMNTHMTQVDTVFLATSPEFSFVSSSLVKEIVKGGADASALVPAAVLTRLNETLAP